MKILKNIKEIKMKINADHKLLLDLFEQDPDLKIEVKKNILETSLKHESWKIIDEKVRIALTSVISEFNYEIIERKSYNKFVLSESLKSLIKKQFDNELSGFIENEIEKMEEAIEEKINEKTKYFESLIDDYIDKQINKGLAQYIEKQIKMKINQVIKTLKEEN
jgi:hypothetical protein